MENKEIWNAVRTPPPSVLKPIQAGRLKGKTDISPQWRYEVMTETLGVCGIGWKYTIDETWLTDGSDGQVIVNARIGLSIKVDGEWSDLIPGIGGSMLVAKEREGLHTSDEAYKMAVTDALSVAMKMIGVAADIYLGLWDGTKYKDAQSPAKQQPKPAQKPIPEATSATRSGTEVKTRRFHTPRDFYDTCKERWGMDKSAVDAETDGIDKTTLKGVEEAFAALEATRGDKGLFENETR